MKDVHAERMHGKRPKGRSSYTRSRALASKDSFSERTRVWMRPLTGEQIRNYFTKMNPLDKAGGYAIQEHGEGIIERIEGSYTNVVGLPVERLLATLQRIGVVG